MVTVLMATYRGKQYLEQQLDTILAQTVPVRILISDDGSDDGNPGNAGELRRMVSGTRCFCIIGHSTLAARPETFSG